VAHYRLGRWSEAVADFEAAARANPRSGSIYGKVRESARRKVKGEE